MLHNYGSTEYHELLSFVLDCLNVLTLIPFHAIGYDCGRDERGEWLEWLMAMGSLYNKLIRRMEGFRRKSQLQFDRNEIVRCAFTCNGIKSFLKAEIFDLRWINCTWFACHCIADWNTCQLVWILPGALYSLIET